MAREPIFKTRFSFTDAKIKGLCVETKPSQIIAFYAYKSVHMYNKKKNKWALNVVYRKMWHWAKNTGFD